MDPLSSLAPRDILIENILTKGVSRVIDTDHLRDRLRSGQPLRVKFGIDPTARIVHIGHAVPILKLRALQEMGHQIIILIGDATAQVGDSSDKDAERPMLQREETRKNAETYVSQFAKILDVSKVEIYYNSQGLDAVNFCGVGDLAKHFSVAEMLDRDNFSKRYKAGVRISLQEFLYPIMQGYDSVALKADLELGGNDQYFNLLAGRRLQEAFGQPKQDIMMFNLIEGTDGRKMSKTYGNYIALDTPANEMFTKVMAINDDLIMRYFEHCTPLRMDEIAPYQARLASGEHPRTIKSELAREIVTLYHGADAAVAAREYFEGVIAGGGRPSVGDIETVHLPEPSYTIVALLKALGMAGTTGEARDAVTGGGVRVDEKEIRDIIHTVMLDTATPVLVQMGRKKFKYVMKG